LAKQWLAMGDGSQVGDGLERPDNADKENDLALGSATMNFEFRTLNST